MLRSMYSGISGLKNHQTKLDVIGNNISNVNTHGFKKGRVIFKDLISQTQSGATGPTQATGGMNAKQVGLGGQLAAIDTLHGTGSLQTTGRTLDVAMEGEGFFVVGRYNEAAGDEFEGEGEPLFTNFEEVRYTRAGNFYLDSNGILVDGSGNYVIGYGAPDGTDGLAGVIGVETPVEMLDPDTGLEVEGLITYENAGELNENESGFLSTVTEAGKIRIPQNAQSMSIGVDGKVSYVGSDGILYYAGQIAIAKFANAEGLTKEGSNYYINTNNSGVPQFAAGNVLGLGKTVSGSLEMSNVDLSEEFTEMIVAQRGFQANSRIITTSDEILQELVNLKR